MGVATPRHLLVAPPTHVSVNTLFHVGAPLHSLVVLALPTYHVVATTHLHVAVAIPCYVGPPPLSRVDALTPFHVGIATIHHVCTTRPQLFCITLLPLASTIPRHVPVSLPQHSAAVVPCHGAVPGFSLATATLTCP